MSAKRALVTGGSGAIGGAICWELALSGFEVIVHAHSNRSAAEQLVEKIRGAGGSASSVTFDVTNADEVTKAAEVILEQGPIQVLVSNAGFHRDAPLAGMKTEDWYEVVDTSLNGFFNVVKPFLLPMIRTRWGRIIGVSSISGIIGNRGQTNYAAAKAGMHGAIKSLVHEVASRGVTANAVAPGIIATEETMKKFDKELIGALVPSKKAGTPEDVAYLVGFLASEKSGYINGQIVSVSGGLG